MKLFTPKQEELSNRSKGEEGGTTTATPMFFR